MQRCATLQFTIQPTDATNRPDRNPRPRCPLLWLDSSAGTRHLSGSKSPAICRNNSHYITKRCANRNGYEGGKLKGFAIMVAPKYPWGFGLRFAFCCFPTCHGIWPILLLNNGANPAEHKGKKCRNQA